MNYHNTCKENNKIIKSHNGGLNNFLTNIISFANKANKGNVVQRPLRHRKIYGPSFRLCCMHTNITNGGQSRRGGTSTFTYFFSSRGNDTVASSPKTPWPLGHLPTLFQYPNRIEDQTARARQHKPVGFLCLAAPPPVPSKT